MTKRALTSPLGKAVLLLGSTLVSLGLAEVAVRVLRPQVTLNAYEQRFRVDGVPTYSPGWFDSRDPVLPVVIRPGYDHKVVDIAWNPVPFSVSTDQHGFRNPAARPSPAQVAIIGDSVVFGYGVEARDTIAGALERLSGTAVDNLGLPNAGLESYPVLLGRYLERSARPGTIIVFVYAGNDFENLKNSSWAELHACRAAATKIYRRDVAPFAANYPAWAMTGILKWSQLAVLLAGVTTTKPVEEPWQQAHVHHVAGEAAVATLHVISPTEDDTRDAIRQARTYSALVARQSCTRDDERGGLAAHLRALEAGDFHTAASMGADLVKRLNARRCAEIDPESMINPVPWFSFYGAYYWVRRAERAEGALEQYERLVATMADAPAFSAFSEPLRALLPHLRSRDVAAAAEIADLASRIDRAFPAPFPAPPPTCDRVRMSVRALRDLATGAGARLLIVYSVSERQLRTLGDGGFKEGEQFCDAVRGDQVPCLNLAPTLAELSKVGSAALYLDGAHFTPSGNTVAATQIDAFMRRTESQGGHQRLRGES